ncbi:uncharacterized protein A1O5_04809, partial [Cladophialophora psammophila CBS 110553]
RRISWRLATSIRHHPRGRRLLLIHPLANAGPVEKRDAPGGPWYSEMAIPVNVQEYFHHKW